MAKERSSKNSRLRKSHLTRQGGLINNTDPHTPQGRLTLPGNIQVGARSTESLDRGNLELPKQLS